MKRLLFAAIIISLLAGCSAESTKEIVLGGLEAATEVVENSDAVIETRECTVTKMVDQDVLTAPIYIVEVTVDEDGLSTSFKVDKETYRELEVGSSISLELAVLSNKDKTVYTPCKVTYELDDIEIMG